MNRQELLDIINGECDSVQKLFVEKNQSYGNKHDGFHNFRETARRVHGDDSYENMFNVLLTLMDKHLVALANKGVADVEFKNRLRDIIVYSLIAIAMQENNIHEQRMSVFMNTTTQTKTKKR